MTRKYNTEIHIDQNDKWYFRGEEITNREILEFFKSGLAEDEQGIYIKNKHGELSEHGYIKAEGFPLHIIHIYNSSDGLVFECETGKKYPARDLLYYRTLDDIFFVIKKESRYIKYRLERNCSNEIMDFLFDDNDRIVVVSGNYNYPVSLWEDATGVSLP